MRDCVFRPRAQLDLESIAIFLGVERKSPQAALDAIGKIEKAIDLARDLPDIGGHLRIDGLEHEYRTIPADPYMVYYRYDAEAITVYRVLHQRQGIDVYTLVDL